MRLDWTVPYGLAFDESGNLYATDYIGGQIHRFTPAGTHITFASGLSYPTGIAFSRRPPLQIEAVGDVLTLSWPATATNYVLQTVASLSSTNWTTVENATPGGTLTNNTVSGFFRLQFQP